MMTNGPAATIGEILDVKLERPRDRLALADNPEYNHYRHEVLTFLYEKQKKVETKKHTKIKTSDQEENKKITKPRKTAPRKKPPVKEKAENALKPVENPKTGWWDD